MRWQAVRRHDRLEKPWRWTKAPKAEPILKFEPVLKSRQGQLCTSRDRRLLFSIDTGSIQQRALSGYTTFLDYSACHTGRAHESEILAFSLHLYALVEQHLVEVDQFSDLILRFIEEIELPMFL